MTMMMNQVLPLPPPCPLPDKDTAITFIVAERFQAWDFLGPRDRVITDSTISLADFVSPGANPISTHVGIPDSSPDGKCIAGTVLRRTLAMPEWSNRLFVCVLMSDSDDEELTGQGRFDLKFKVIYGVKGAVPEDEAVEWDLVTGGPAVEVLRACKPPLRCLRKFPPCPLPDKDTAITFIVAERFQAWDFLGPRDRVITDSTISLADFVSPGANPISTHVGIPDSSPDGKCIAGTVLRRTLAMPEWSNRLFVCVLMSDSDDEELTGQGRFDLKFTVIYGVKGAVPEDEAVEWDLVTGGPAVEVLRACKPPLRCLRKVAVKRICKRLFGKM